MLHCVVVALSASCTGLRAPLRSPHVHGRLATRPVLHQRAAAAVGAPAVGDVQATEAVECRASAMAAQPKESEPVAPAAHELCCDNRGPVQASSNSFGSVAGAVELTRLPRRADRALRPVMLADGSDEVPGSIISDDERGPYEGIRQALGYTPALLDPRFLRHPWFPGVVILGLLQVSTTLEDLLGAGLVKDAFDVLIHAAIWPIALEFCDVKDKRQYNTIFLRFISLVFFAYLTIGTLSPIVMLAEDLASFV